MKKLYFTQIELAEIIDEQTHTIRYWESIFPVLQPKTVRNGRRVYTEKNVEFFRFVKKLIRDDKLSNAGVKEVINNKKNHSEFVSASYKKTTVCEEIPHQVRYDSNTMQYDSENNKHAVCVPHQVRYDNTVENKNITFTREEFAELLQIIQMMILLIKSK